MTSRKITVVYHDNCMDGFCSAWLAWRRFHDTAEYIPASYGQDPPNLEGKDVFILDFSYKYSQMMDIINSAHTIAILDHHVTAEQELAPIRDAKYLHADVIFDMNRSGAGITRDYFFEGWDCWLVDYVQDRDLWKWQLPDSKPVNAYLATLPRHFEAWDNAWEMLNPSNAARLGQGAQAYLDMYVRETKKQAILATFAGYEDIPLVNASYTGISELLNELAENALFAVGWRMRADCKIQFNLRSKGEFDVSVMAKIYNGGGHKNAAGFTLSLEECSKHMSWCNILNRVF